MKKILSLVFVTALIIPNLAFASWWNPTSWFNNWSFSNATDSKTQVLEKKIAELESKLNNNDNTNVKIASTSEIEIVIATSTTATSTPIIKKKIKVETTPTVDNSAIIKAQVKAQVEATLKARAEQDALIAKQKAEEQAKIDAQNSMNIANQQAQNIKDAEAKQRAQDALDIENGRLQTARNIRVKIAEMDQLLLVLYSMHSDPDSVSIVNKATNLYGDKFFDRYIAGGEIYSDNATLITKVKNYKAELNIELQKYQ